MTRPEVESTTRRLSRVSSASSLTSTSSHKSRGRRGSTSDRKVRPKKKRKIVSMILINNVQSNLGKYAFSSCLMLRSVITFGPKLITVLVATIKLLCSVVSYVHDNYNKYVGDWGP